MIYVLDLDGTLIDSSERHYLLMQQILEMRLNPNSEMNPKIDSKTYPIFDAAEFMKYKADGNSGKKYLTECLNLQETLAAEIMLLWQAQIEEEQWILHDKLYPDTLKFLDWIKKRNGKIYFLTARQKEEELLHEVKSLGIADYADEICVVSPADALEQKKSFVKKMIESDGKTDRMITDKHVRDDSIYVVGDTENEYILAKELSLPQSILNRGFRSKEYWDNRGVRSVASLQEVMVEIDAMLY